MPEKVKKTHSKIEYKWFSKAEGKPWLHVATITYPGKKVSQNFKTRQEAEQWIADNEYTMMPTWEEVTGNGRWSAE
mgnify:CR=1 FL=1